MKLDARQRAMLAEMGIWLPAPPASKAAPRPAPPHSAPPARRTAPPRPQPLVDSAPAPAALLAPDTEARAARIAQLDWDALCAEAQQCHACDLCQQRKNVAFEGGSRTARWLIVGEAPGEQEDLQGAPFVGPAGQLLDAMLAALHLSRESNNIDNAVYIANVLKCRPPGNRNPQPDEVAHCSPFLQRQMALLAPRVILALGRFAAQSLLQTQEPIGRLRGRVHDWHGTPLIVSYHPAYLLRSPHAKAHAWHDLCLAQQASCSSSTNSTS